MQKLRMYGKCFNGNCQSHKHIYYWNSLFSFSVWFISLTIILLLKSFIRIGSIYDVITFQNHVIGWGEAKVIGTEQDRYKRWVKEAVEIRKRGATTMNWDEGQYHLSRVFDELLLAGDKPSRNSRSVAKQPTSDDSSS